MVGIPPGTSESISPFETVPYFTTDPSDSHKMIRAALQKLQLKFGSATYTLSVTFNNEYSAAFSWQGGTTTFYGRGSSPNSVTASCLAVLNLEDILGGKLLGN